MILTDQVERNERLWNQGLDAYPSTFGETMGANFDESIARNPTPSLMREMDRQGYYPTTDEFGIEGPARKDAPILDAKRANDEYGIPGELSFGRDIPEPIAEELHRLKRDELQRRDVLNRATGGFFRTVAGFGVSLGASVLDPINVASAFIPVVGPARYGVWASKYGPTAARLAKGGIEGLTGAALVEPLVYGVAQQEQADYHAADSLMNLAFGTAIGGGLHAGLGKIGDLIAARHAQEPMLRAAVAALAEDRLVDVESGFRADLLSNVYTRGLDDLLPPELKAARDLQAREVQGPPEAAGPPVDGFALTRQVENVRSQRDAAQAEFERLTAERDKAANLAKDVTDTETARLSAAIAEADAAKKSALADEKKLRDSWKAAGVEKERADGRLAVQVGSGIEGPDRLKAERQAEAAAKKFNAVDQRRTDARTRAKEADTRKAELKDQLDNYKANREKVVRSTLDPLEAKVTAAKQASDIEARNLASAEKVLSDYTSGRLAALQESIEAQRVRAREDFMNRAVKISRREPMPDEIQARAEIEDIAARADQPSDAPAADQVKLAEADIIDLTERLKAFGNDVDLGDGVKIADQKAKAYEQAAVCDYMRMAAE